ncbi:hypothetical protein F4810DRAFT_226107 [Camillea tinctor]|nr:hypothetical protein F4810DRAFT_226107 [Camillea tinctor]
MTRLQQTEQQQYEATQDPPLFILEQDVMRFVRDHYSKHPGYKGAWNSRQIRNGFTIAASLVRSEAEQPDTIGTNFQPQLRASHFERVESYMDELDRFRAHVLDGDDARKAFLNGERDDDYENQKKNKNVPNTASQFSLPQFMYMSPQLPAQNGEGGPHPIRTSFGQPAQFSTQPSVLSSHARSHLSQTTGQFPIPQENTMPNIPISTQTRGPYIVVGSPPQDSVRRPFVESQNSTTGPGTFQSAYQPSSHI